MKLKKGTIIDKKIVDTAVKEQNIDDLGKATIREIVTIVNSIEARSGEQFIRMEMGVPGLSAPQIGVDAEVEALKKGLASAYPPLDGAKIFKREASRFAKAFIDIDLPEECFVPTVGTMQASFALFMAVSNLSPTKDTILFIDPGFPVQKQQLKVLGIKYQTFDIFDCRGDKLKEKLESYLINENICAIVYSNPNNPTWICLRPNELETIGKLCDKYDAIAIEDLAYFGMDFRQDISTPFQPPYQATVAKYTNNYALLISSSKVFSYAGQRLGTLCISHRLFSTYFESLKIRFGVGNFGPVIVGRLLYSLSSGASHSAQYAVAAMYKAACDGKYNFIEELREYGIKAKLMKELFLRYGFYIVYDKDIDEQIADGFYFTIGYPGLSEGELLQKLLYFGISGLGLRNTGSRIQGVRACVSQTKLSRFTELEKRLAMFEQSF
ncbi:Aspartate/methionine/tyrosine aminotransferase [Saccharicrinis carchari]|uniref:Aspartate/methionine/tyrosine aminotransferase n=1 Tax=Saccharicrinis carchari TaxID=1168039 RepID=A0A521DCY8_SACCC|nr:pyridoxal phosphate-dependent aminotransferase [Saccharicrinis carchari]SMO69674.1 Aspartate/methionine/tyrosine aminotransferase [Saccharicrinis carchari]